MELIFEDPPKRQNAGRPVSEEDLKIAEALRERPFRYARCYEYEEADQRAGARAHDINAGKRAAFPKGEFKAVSRKIDGKGFVYVMYTGTKQSAD